MLRRTHGVYRPLRVRPAERGFKFSLPLTVEGPDADGSLFREETTLDYMSHAGALFPLRSPVALGSRLKLVVALPDKLAEGRGLKLVVKGTIIDIDARRSEDRAPKIALRLESRYAIESDAQEGRGA